MLRSLSGMSNLPWCIIGDLNDLLSSEDKCGRVKHPYWLSNGFRETVATCSLSDIELMITLLCGGEVEGLIMQLRNPLIDLWPRRNGFLIFLMPV